MDELFPDTWTSDAILAGVAEFLGNALFLALLVVVAAIALGPRLFRMVVRVIRSI